MRILDTRVLVRIRRIRIVANGKRIIVQLYVNFYLCTVPRWRLADMGKDIQLLRTVRTF